MREHHGNSYTGVKEKNQTTPRLHLHLLHPHDVVNVFAFTLLQHRVASSLIMDLVSLWFAVSFMVVSLWSACVRGDGCVLVACVCLGWARGGGRWWVSWWLTMVGFVVVLNGGLVKINPQNTPKKE